MKEFEKFYLFFYLFIFFWNPKVFIIAMHKLFTQLTILYYFTVQNKLNGTYGLT